MLYKKVRTAEEPTIDSCAREASLADGGADVELHRRPGAGEPFASILSRRIRRRSFLKGMASSTPLLLAGPGILLPEMAYTRESRTSVDSLQFLPIEGSNEDKVIVPHDYRYDLVIRWGESLDPMTASLDTSRLVEGAALEPGAAELQARQFGYNNDAVEFFPFRNAFRRRGVVCVNHEYTNEELIFPGFGNAAAYPSDADPTAFDVAKFVAAFPQSVAFAQNAHGISVVEIDKRAGRWTFERNSFFNRRITANTSIRISGPATGAELLRTAADPDGRLVLGTLNNCAGGQTPWGTYLSAEENFDQYFGNYGAYVSDVNADPKIVDAHVRLPLPEGVSNRGWELVDERFDVAKNPTEPLRFGWIVEVDPHDPRRRARKRTALGRFKHECATTTLSKDRRAVVYSGDDASFEYLYKYVSQLKYDPQNPRRNRNNLLNHGTLYVARFNDDATGEWLPLVYDEGGPLNPSVGFTSQSDVLIKTRAAADVLGATPMDRPEDVEANPATGKVYMACTNNAARSEASIPNPRTPNAWGHIIEITEEGNDNGATRFNWEIFMLCGDPLAADGTFLTNMMDVGELPLAPNDTYFAGYPDPSVISPIGSPDNVAFDNLGNLWLITDGGQPRGVNDGAFACPTEGPYRGLLRQFLSAPVGAEVCGGEFTPDDRALFIAIQHPGQGGTLAAPTSHWPDGNGLPPRPSLIAVSKQRGNRRIGS